MSILYEALTFNTHTHTHTISLIIIYMHLKERWDTNDKNSDALISFDQSSTFVKFVNPGISHNFFS
jgi:hypothetical protein